MLDSSAGGGGPHLFAAFLCEKVLQEKDSVISFIRIVDRFIRPEPNSQIPMPPIQGVIVVGFKAGSLPGGKYKVILRVKKPDESQIAEMTNEVFFEGGQDRGLVVGLPFVMVPDEEGVYWIDVFFMEQMATRIPVRVIFQSMPAIPSQPGS
jgi:hypothetical protein